MSELDFGARVRSRRRLLKLSQDDLGKAIGISQVAIRKIEAGGQTRHGRRIADALKTTLQWLETGSDSTASPSGDLQEGHGYAAVETAPKPYGAIDPAWPLKKATLDRFYALTPAQAKQADGAFDAILRGYEAEREKG
jgi:transcriptional regulator with XRE-family HTH domain